MPKMLPRCPSLIACRQVSVDPATGRPTLEDVLQEFTVTGARGSWDRLVVWAEVEDGLGRFRAGLRVVRPADNLAARLRLAHVEIDVEFNRPRQLRVLVFVVEDLPLPGPGEVELLLLFDGAVTMRRSLPVLAGSPRFN